MNPDRVRMDLVEDFEACISENALWGKGGSAESRQLQLLPEAAPQKSSAKRSAPLDSETPTKRSKIERTSSG